VARKDLVTLSPSHSRGRGGKGRNLSKKSSEVLNNHFSYREKDREKKKGGGKEKKKIGNEDISPGGRGIQTLGSAVQKGERKSAKREKWP